MESCERGMNPVTMTIINPLKDYWPSPELNQQPPVLKSAMLQNELWGLVPFETVLHETLRQAEKL